jgi:hypothetical protein
MTRLLPTWLLCAARLARRLVVSPVYGATASFMEWCAAGGAVRTVLGLLCLPAAFVVYALACLWNVTVGRMDHGR